MLDLKNEILAKTDEKFYEFKNEIISVIKKMIKNEVNKPIGAKVKKQ